MCSFAAQGTGDGSRVRRQSAVGSTNVGWHRRGRAGAQHASVVEVSWGRARAELGTMFLRLCDELGDEDAEENGKEHGKLRH